MIAWLRALSPATFSLKVEEGKEICTEFTSRKGNEMSRGRVIQHCF